MTISIKIKEIMAIMPDTLNTKKEVDDYYKSAMAKVLKDTKTDNENKPKKELNAYQKFMKENISIVKNENPNLTGTEVFSIIAKKWKEQKEENKETKADVKVEEDVKADVKDDVKDDVKADVKADAKDDVKVEEDVKDNVKDDVKEVVKEVKKKKGK
uniref:HMG box domain-containing protein n=1 Tax=viral metagenome TaxID=1070528 RepID=A0A6C0IAB9_9ZZZZ